MKHVTICLYVIQRYKHLNFSECLYAFCWDMTFLGFKPLINAQLKFSCYFHVISMFLYFQSIADDLWKKLRIILCNLIVNLNVWMRCQRTRLSTGNKTKIVIHDDRQKCASPKLEKNLQFFALFWAISLLLGRFRRHLNR